ncbi:MAG TPA: ABC-2 family transporter protein [Caulobacteraceae bacterium]|jgi:ABC-2 type transport system permease protein|nr:ABC-2 family transporter protein [Caulobacteraceae bacterium]
MRLVIATLQQSGAAVRSALGDRGAFWLQAGGMLVNNGFWLLMWFLFFSRFQQVGGWGLTDVARLIGIVYLLFGLSSVFLGGYRDLAGVVLRGDLDALLTQPGPVLPRMLTRESLPSAWGDVLAGAVVLAASARLDGAGAALALLAVGVGALVWLSTAVIFSSLAFWLAGSRSLSRDLMDFTLMASTWPASIYSGWTRVLVFTLLPAGFIAITPAQLVRAPSLKVLSLALGSAVVFPLVASMVFGAGIARYRRDGGVTA